MRNKLIWLLSAGIVTLGLVTAGQSQPPPQKGGPPGKKGQFPGKKGPAPSVGEDQLVERIMAFDTKGTGKVSADDLPERMQHLVAMGDTNHDGFLDRKEVTELATTLSAFVEEVSPAAPNKGKGKGKGGPGGAPVASAGGNAQRALDELDLVPSTRDSAQQVVQAYTEKVRRAQDLARAELLVQMKGLLREQDLTRFQIALDEPAGPPPGPPKKGPGPFGGKKGPPPPPGFFDE